LNSLFVYEARAAFLIRVAQTRQGADRLLEHRIFAVLAESEFISAKPDIDRRSVPSERQSSVADLHLILVNRLGKLSTRSYPTLPPATPSSASTHG
jgi:hypothetical protein